ncbi:hypothetical protein BZP36_18875 [Raoultella terrigena]|nr:hypothetical protein BZP36_18875 [Raoultella terrigena]
MRTAEIKKWREVSKFHFEEMANLRRPNPPASVHPRGNRAGRGEPNKFCRPSEQKDAPTRRFIWGACPAHRRR